MPSGLVADYRWSNGNADSKAGSSQGMALCTAGYQAAQHCLQARCHERTSASRGRLSRYDDDFSYSVLILLKLRECLADLVEWPGMRDQRREARQVSR